MKSKLFKLFSLIVLIFLGVSLGFAQHVGKVQSFTSRVDTAFQVYTNVSGVENGYDTTTYTGILTSPWKIRGAAWGNNTYRNTLGRVPGAAAQSWTRPTASVQLFPWVNGPSTGSNRYIRIAQGDFSPKFKFFNGDTLYLTFASGNSGYRARFQFDSTQPFSIYTAGGGNLAYTNYLPIMHFLKFKSDWRNYNERTNNYANRVTNNILGAGTLNYKNWNPKLATTMTNATSDSGKTRTNYGGNTNNNTVEVRGFNPDTIMVVFDSVVNTTATEFPNIYISNLNVQAIDSLLQGRSSGVADTIIAAIGRGYNAYVDGTRDTRNGRASGQVQQGATDYRLYQPTCIDGSWELATNMDGTGTYYGGTPVVKITLLPGDATFVRWNVGINPEFGWNPRPSTVTNYLDRMYNDILLPTPRREHRRVRYTAAAEAAKVGEDSMAFRAGDTCTIINVGVAVPATRTRDTLYIFDKDSNITVDTIGTSQVIASVMGTSGTVGLLALDSALSNTPIYPNGQLKVWSPVVSPRGRVVIDWSNTVIQGRHYASANRTVKIRLATNLSALGIQNDTLNGPYPNFCETKNGVGGPTLGRYAKGGLTEKTAYAASGFTYVDTTVLFRATKPSKMDVYYRRDSLINATTGWTLWTGDITMSRSDVQSSQTNPYAFKTIVKDTFGNVVDRAVVGFQSSSDNVVWDTVWKNGHDYTPPALVTTNRYGYGARILRPTGTADQPVTSTPGKTIYTVYVRNNDQLPLSTQNAAFDDNGTAGVMVKFYDLCMNSTTFTFNLYQDVDTVHTAALPTTGSIDSLWKVYTRTTAGSALGIPTYMKVTPYQFNDAAVPGAINRTSNWPNIPDSVTTSTIAASNLPTLRNIDTLEVTVTDECERPVAITDTNLYVGTNPTAANGGFVACSGNARIVSAISGSTGRRDGLGQFIARFIPVAGGNKIRFTYLVPNVRLDTVKLVVRFTSDPSITDNIVVRTISGPPVTLALVRPYGQSTTVPAFPVTTNYPPAYTGIADFAVNGVSYNAARLKPATGVDANGMNANQAAHYSDSVLIASNYDLYVGVAGSYNNAYDDFPNTYTFVTGQCRDANGDTLTGGVAGRSITWKLLGPSPNSMSIANASRIFGEDATGKPKFGQPPIMTFADATVAGLTGRQLSIPVATDGNAYALLVSGKVGGGGHGPLNPEGVSTNSYVAPTEPNWNPFAQYTAYHVFPVERQSIFPYAFDAATDSVYQFIGVDGAWKNIADYINYGVPTSYTLANGRLVNDNGRGFNQLVASMDGTTWITGTTDTRQTSGQRPLIYHVVPDTSHDLRVAWVDMSGDLFDNPSGDLNDRPELQGRSTARVVNQTLSTSNELTLRRMVIKGTGNTKVGNTSYTNSQTNGTNYSGNINTLYVREFDRFGNPIVRRDWARNLTITLLGHSSYRPPYITQFNLTNNKADNVPNPYFKAPSLANLSKWGQVKDSSGVVIPRFTNGTLGSTNDANQIGVETSINNTLGWRTNHANFGAVADTNKWLVNGDATSQPVIAAAPNSLPWYTQPFSAAANRQLRGAIGFKYQTMWVDSTAADGSFANVTDTAVFFAVSNRSAYPDTAFVASTNFTDQPVTVNFADAGTYKQVVGQANRLGSIFVTSPDGYYITWFNLTSANAGAPAIPHTKWLAPSIFAFAIDLDGIANLNPKLSAKNSALAVPNTDPKWVVNPDAPIYDMPGMDHINRTSFVKAYYNAAGIIPSNFWPSTSFNDGSTSQGLRMPYTENVAKTTYAGGGYVVSNNVWYKGYRDGLYKLKLAQNSTSTITANAYFFTNIYRFYADGAHFVTMTNPNSNHPELEPTDPRPGYGKLYPVRANYFANGGHYNPEKAYLIPNAYYDTIEQYNGLYAYLQNLNPPNDIRNYSSLGTANNVDTIFYNQDYKVTLRVYDRFGNIIKKPRLWLSNAVQFNQPFPTQNILTNKPTQGTQLNEWPVMVDTNTIKDTLQLCDTLTVKFVQNVGDQTPTAMNGQLMLKYSNNVGSQNQSLLVVDPFNLYNGHDAPQAADSRVMSSRNIFVRAQSAPGAFSIDQIGPSKLVRIDNGTFTWKPTWGYARSTNMADDGIKYKLMFANPDGSNAIAVVDNLTYPLTQTTGLSTTLDSATLVNVLSLGPKSSDGKQWNRDVKWYVIAYNKWYNATTAPNLATTSTNSDLVTVELNAVPTIAFKSIQAKETDPAFGTIIVNPDTKVTLTMSQTDANGIKYGATAPYNVTSYGVTYPNTLAPIDSLYYQVTLTWKSSYPGTTALPTKVDVINTINPWKEYSSAELWGLLATEDSVTYTVTVKAVDRAIDTANGFANAKVTVSKDLTLTKIDGNYSNIYSG